MRRVILAVAVLLLVGPVSAQSDVDEQKVPLPVPEVIEVPAGVNLISTPVDAGSGLACDAFEGIEPEWPLFFGWDSSGQRFTGSDETMLAMGAGYWFYTPAPTTLITFGEPYRSLTHLTRSIPPGWHLFGVPYTEGIDWNGFRLYRSGNPVSLETAKELGWIRLPVLGQWGSEWQSHEAGQPFQPGRAYWVRTTVPLAVRAEPHSTVAAGGLAGTPAPAGGSSKDKAEVATGWICEIGEALKSLKEAGTEVAEGHWAMASFDALGAAFGLAHYGLEVTTNQLMDQLKEMDKKLDELLVDMDKISSQIADLQNNIEVVKDTIEENRLKDDIDSAKNWLDSFYIDPKVVPAGRSRAWARWAMAGCETTADVCENEITQQSYDAFQTNWCKAPGTLEYNYNDFFLFWSYSVLGYQGQGVETYKAKNGMDAQEIVNAMHTTMLADPTTMDNPLMAFQDKLFRSGDCKSDVTNPQCDLYTDVYLPFEAFFQQAVGSQTLLVQALVEASSVMAQVYPAQHYNDSATAVSNFERQLADEVEMFLKVAEQIALYRAADGRTDWSTFSTTDAAQLLARADFVAMRVIGHAYDPNRANPTLNPPWPEQGVAGRIFYAADEPSQVTTRQVCPTSGACTSYPEVTGNPRVATGIWPYLVWTPSGDTAIGMPKKDWGVRRLQPINLPVGEYTVTSAVPARGKTSIVVANYNDSYTDDPKANPDEPTQRVLPFASFVGLEAKLGPWALSSSRMTWSKSGGKNNDTHTFAVTMGNTAATVTVTYKNTKDYITESADWSASAKIKLPADATYTDYPEARVYWPAAFSTYLQAWRSTDYLLCGTCVPGGYFRTLQQELKLVDSDGHTVGTADLVSKPCGEGPFDDCSQSSDSHGNGALSSSALSLKQDKTYTFKASYSDKVQSGVNKNGCTAAGCLWHWEPTPDSYVTWQPSYPTITLVK